MTQVLTKIRGPGWRRRKGWNHWGSGWRFRRVGGSCEGLCGWFAKSESERKMEVHCHRETCPKELYSVGKELQNADIRSIDSEECVRAI